jgi:hypothetical protein
MRVIQFIAGCGVAMLITESPFFIDMLKSLNEAYVKTFLPKAACFTRTWLPQLYKEVEGKIEILWNSSGDVLRSLGSDGFTGEDSSKVNIITETMLDKVAFMDCVDQGEDRADAEYTANLWMERLIMTAGDGEEVEETFAAVVADNTSVNPCAGKIVEETYPRVLRNPGERERLH